MAKSTRGYQEPVEQGCDTGMAILEVGHVANGKAYASGENGALLWPCQ